MTRKYLPEEICANCAKPLPKKGELGGRIVAHEGDFCSMKCADEWEHFHAPFAPKKKSMQDAVREMEEANDALLKIAAIIKPLSVEAKTIVYSGVMALHMRDALEAVTKSRKGKH